MAIQQLLASYPAPGGGGGVAFVSASAFAFPSSSNNLSLTVPAGIVAGDVVLIFYQNSNTTRTVTTPSGLTLQLNNSALNSSIRVYSRVCDGTEPAAWVFAMSSSDRAGAIALLYRGAAGTITVGAVNNTPSGSVMTASSIAAPSAAALVAYSGMEATGSSATSGPAGMTQRATANGDLVSAVAYDESVASGATGSRSITWSAATGAGPTLLVAVS